MATIAVRSNVGALLYGPLVQAGYDPATYRYTVLVEGVETDGFPFRAAIAEDPEDATTQIRDLLDLFADFLDDEEDES
jgi:hypothetical protein